MKTFKCLPVAICFAFGSISGFADILVDQPLNPQNGGAFSNLGFAQGADQFVLDNDADISRVRWFGYYRGFDLDPTTTEVSFRIRVFSSTSFPQSEIPDHSRAVLARVQDSGFRVSASDPLDGGRVIYEFEADLFPVIPLSHSKKHWISVLNFTPHPAQWLWKFALAESNEKIAFRVPGTHWTLFRPLDVQFALTLEGTTR